MAERSAIVLAVLDPTVRSEVVLGHMLETSSRRVCTTIALLLRRSIALPEDGPDSKHGE